MLATAVLWHDTESKTALLISEVIIIIPLLTLALVRRYNIGQTLRWRSAPPSSYLPAFIIGLGCGIVFDEFDRIVQFFFPMNEDVLHSLSTLLRGETAVEWIIIASAVVIVAPLAEETLFRGYIQRLFEKKKGVTSGIMTAALLFGLLHFNPWWFVQILILGVFLGVIAWKADSILPAALTHGVYNCFGLVFINSGEKPLPFYEWGQHVSPLYVGVGALMIYAGFKKLYQAGAS